MSEPVVETRVRRFSEQQRLDMGEHLQTVIDAIAQRAIDQRVMFTYAADGSVTFYWREKAPVA